MDMADNFYSVLTHVRSSENIGLDSLIERLVCF